MHFHRIPLLSCGGQTVGSKSGSQLGDKDDLAHTYGKKVA